MINTIGPVWDGNEVWVLVAGGATFAAFPEWYATLFSGFYLPLLLILVALIVRGVAFEYRGKVDDDRLAAQLGHARSSSARALPALLWGVAFANIVRGVPIDADDEYTGNLFDPAEPVRAARRAGHAGAVHLHGAVFLALKTDGDDPGTRPARSPAGSARGRRARRRRSWSGRSSAHGDALAWALRPAGRGRAGRRGAGANRTGREGWAFALTGVTIVRSPSRCCSPRCSRT